MRSLTSSGAGLALLSGTLAPAEVAAGSISLRGSCSPSRCGTPAARLVHTALVSHLTYTCFCCSAVTFSRLPARSAAARDTSGGSPTATDPQRLTSAEPLHPPGVGLAAAVARPDS
eukprot:4508209-Prymnesium_polylepis.1